MPTVTTLKLYGAGTEASGEVFVSLEHTPVVLADIRAALPRLKKDLSSRWQIEHVEIENRLPRRRNPVNPAQVSQAIAGGCVGILILFTVATVRAAGKKVGEAAGEEIGECVRRWIRQITAAPKRKKKSG